MVQLPVFLKARRNPRPRYDNGHLSWHISHTNFDYITDIEITYRLDTVECAVILNDGRGYILDGKNATTFIELYGRYVDRLNHTDKEPDWQV